MLKGGNTVGEETWVAKMDPALKGYCNCDEKHDPTWKDDGQNFVKCPGIMKRRDPSTTPADEIILRAKDYLYTAYGKHRSMKCNYCGVIISASPDSIPENSQCDRYVCRECGKRRSS